MQFDNSVTLGSILTLAAMVWAAGYAVAQIRASLREVERTLVEQATLIRDFMSESRADRLAIHSEMKRLKRLGERKGYKE